MKDRKLAEWVAAGVIDPAAARRIAAYEAGHARPIALWAVIGIGALAIGLGLISLVAANWAAIPAQVRLAVHLALLAGVALALWQGRSQVADRPWRHEALLFVFAALGLTFLGHVGQAYQTTSPLWQPLAVWLALFGPVLLARGHGWLTAAALVLAAIWAVWGFALDQPPTDYSVLRLALLTALPLGFAPLGAAMRTRAPRPAFWRRIEELGFVYALVGASAIAAIAGHTDFGEPNERNDILTTLLVWAGAGLAAGAVVWRVRPDRSGRAGALLLVAAGVLTAIAFPLSGTRLAGAALFFALWGMVAAMALRGGWRGVFQAAVGILALRLIVLSFELGDDLLSSGAGLVFGGLIVLGTAWAAVRVMRRFAPPPADGPAGEAA